MIRDPKAFEAFERDLISNSRVDIEQNFRIVDALYQEALQLGLFQPGDPFEGIDNIVQIAKVVNSVPGTPH
ncbi:MAG: hypothetical protein OEW15_02585 [Nitrospirota bacterium]|nr:hypothetical protein [Nitrospirota bacterium]